MNSTPLRSPKSQNAHITCLSILRIWTFLTYEDVDFTTNVLWEWSKSKIRYESVTTCVKFWKLLLLFHNASVDYFCGKTIHRVVHRCYSPQRHLIQPNQKVYKRWSRPFSRGSPLFSAVHSMYSRIQACTGYMMSLTSLVKFADLLVDEVFTRCRRWVRIPWELLTCTLTVQSWWVSTLSFPRLSSSQLSSSLQLSSVRTYFAHSEVFFKVKYSFWWILWSYKCILW